MTGFFLLNCKVNLLNAFIVVMRIECKKWELQINSQVNCPETWWDDVLCIWKHLSMPQHLSTVSIRCGNHCKCPVSSTISPSSLLGYSTHYCSGSFLSHWAAQWQGSITFNLISPAALALAPLAGIVSTFRTMAHTITDCFQIGRNIIRVLEWQREKEGVWGVY